MPIKIGIILGSTRTSSNTIGLSKYLESILSTHYSTFLEVEVIHLTNSPGHPLPLHLGDSIPAAHPSNAGILPGSYADPAIQSWSRTVLGWDGLIIVTPQYNWGYPAILKNCLDQLYHEWKDLPCGLITLGGHGGSKCMEALKIVCEGGLKMRVLGGNVQVKLDRSLITGQERIKGDEGWLDAYGEGTRGMVDELIDAIEVRRGEKGLNGIQS